MQIRTMFDVGMAIKEGREDLGLTQQQLANRSAVSRSWIAQVETGKPSFDMYKVLQVFSALGLRLDAEREPRTVEPRRFARSAKEVG